MSINGNGEEAERAAFAKFKSQLRKAARTDPRITPKARNLVDAILDEIWRTGGYCGSTVSELRVAIGAKCDRTVRRAIADLETLGYFIVERSAGGRKKTNRFRMPAVIPETRTF